MRSLITRFVKEEDGMEMVEWALVAGLFVMVAMLGWNGVAGAITGRLGALAGAINN
jgi:Flp pilus assembly pilin Flp